MPSSRPSVASLWCAVVRWIAPHPSDAERRHARGMVMNTPPAIIEGEAARAGQRAFAKTLGWYVALGLLACTIYVIVLGYNLTRVAEAFGRGSRCGGCRGAAEGSAVRRAGQPLAAIRQIAAPA